MKATINRYVGKVISIVRQDGLFAGLKAILGMLYILLKFPKSADILFVSSGAIGDSWRYRVKNVAEELELNGILSSIVVQENFWLETYAKRFKIFIFHRVSGSPKIQKLIAEIKKQKKEIIFETDDLLFDAELIKEQDFFKNSNALQKKFYEKGVGSEFIDDPYVKVCTTTTTFLAEKLQAHRKKVFLVPNKLSKKDLEIAEKLIEDKRSTSHVPRFTIKIGYFSGTLSHNQDFASINDALLQIMEKYPTVELVLAGPLELENALNKFSDRIRSFPYVSREKHFANVAGVDINLAPLEIENPFCAAKSELKYFEAGIVGVPTVATANQTFREAIDDGIDGFVAKDVDEWTQKLEKLILDEELRKSMGAKAREKALARYTTISAKNEEYYAYLKAKLKK